MIPALVLLGLAAGYISYRLWSNRQRRRDLLGSSLTPEQRRIISRHVPLFRRLPYHLRKPYEGKIRLFLHQVEFIGCDGLHVTEAMRLSIAAQACLLVANHDTWFKTLRTILIYPGAFKSRQARQDGYVVTERDEVRLGESWSRGPVVLSWQHSGDSARQSQDGHNLVIHEFAHQLDNLTGHADGVPLLPDGHSEAQWERVFADAYEKHRRDVRRGWPTAIDPYGTTNRVEFFAVCTELFFEKPQALQGAAPKVYEQMTSLFNLDPAQWDLPRPKPARISTGLPIWTFR